MPANFSMTSIINFRDLSKEGLNKISLLQELQEWPRINAKFAEICSTL